MRCRSTMSRLTLPNSVYVKNDLTCTFLPFFASGMALLSAIVAPVVGAVPMTRLQRARVDLSDMQSRQRVIPGWDELMWLPTSGVRYCSGTRSGWLPFGTSSGRW